MSIHGSGRVILWSLVVGSVAAMGSTYLAFHPDLWFGALLAFSTASVLAQALSQSNLRSMLLAAAIAGGIAEIASLIANVVALPVQIRILQNHPVRHLPLPIAVGSATMLHDLILFNAMRCFFDWGVFIVMVIVIRRILLALAGRHRILN